MMKPVIAIVTIMVSGILSGHCAYAQSFRDLLDKGKEMLDNSNVGDIAADIISGTGNGLTAENICGTWNYVGTAIRFTSDNALADAASVLASKEIEEKFDGYLQKIGLKEGAFSYTFNQDSTFSTTFLKQDLKGTYSISDGDIIELRYGKSDKFDFMHLSPSVSISAWSAEFLFNADKLLDFIGKISSTSGNSTLKSLSEIAGQFDGMKIGFELKRDGQSTADFRRISM